MYRTFCTTRFPPPFLRLIEIHTCAVPKCLKCQKIMINAVNQNHKKVINANLNAVNQTAPIVKA